MCLTTKDRKECIFLKKSPQEVFAKKFYKRTLLPDLRRMLSLKWRASSIREQVFSYSDIERGVLIHKTLKNGDFSGKTNSEASLILG